MKSLGHFERSLKKMSWIFVRKCYGFKDGREPEERA